MVRAVAIGSPDFRVCLAVADVCLWQARDVAEMRKRLSAQMEGEAPLFIPVATHTHASIENTYQFGGRPEADEMEALRSATVRAATAAVVDMAPARLEVGCVAAPLNHNRRVHVGSGGVREAWRYEPGVSTGYADPALTALVFRRRDRHDVAVIHWAAHALTLGRTNTLLSPDFPGALVRRVEQLGEGVCAVYLPGAAGDVNPRRCLGADTAVMNELAGELATRTLDATARAEEVPPHFSALRHQMLTFPNRIAPSAEVAVELSVVRLGDERHSVTLGFVPGEPFAAFQRWFAKSVPADIRGGLVVGYAGGSVGYMAPRAEFDRGGYGITPDPADPVVYSRTRLQRGVPEVVMGRLLEMAVERP